MHFYVIADSIPHGGSKGSASPRNNVYRVTKLVHCFVIDTRKLAC